MGLPLRETQSDNKTRKQRVGVAGSNPRFFFFKRMAIRMLSKVIRELLKLLCATFTGALVRLTTRHIAPAKVECHRLRAIAYLVPVHQRQS